MEIILQLQASSHNLILSCPIYAGELLAWEKKQLFLYEAEAWLRKFPLMLDV